MFVPRSLLLLVLASGCLSGCEKPKMPEPTRRANVVVVTVDTLRADRIGCYGFAEARTPHFDRLAREGIRVEHAIASAPITLPSHATLLTGLYPPAHGVRDNGRQRLPDQVVTLAERLGDEGYQTQAFVSAMVLHRRFNLSQGFDGYDDDLRREGEPAMFMIQERSGEHTMDRVLKWLETRSDQNAPYFLWVHLFDPHQPYEPPPEDAKGAPTLYDGEITSADRQVGRLLRVLRGGGTLDDTIFVFTSDHGESLGEHGEATHALFIYESTVRVPLIFRYPRKLPAGEKYQESVRSVDVMPTILGLLGLQTGDTQGLDLSDALAGKRVAPKLAPYSESLHGQYEFSMAPLHGVRTNHWTYIRAPRPELYDRSQDPGEVRNLLTAPSKKSGAVSQKVAELDGLITEVLERSGRFGFVADTNPLDPDTVKMLKALGYMEGSGAPSGLEGMDPKDGARAFDQLDRARMLAREGKYEQAKKELHALLEWIPTNASARNLLALCEFRTDHAAAAKKLYLQSLAYEPRQPEVLRQLSRIAIAEGDFGEGRARASESLKVDPADVEAMILLAYLDQREAKTDEAKAWYEKAISTDPSYAEAYLQYANLHFRQGEFENARAWYEKALEADPQSANAAMQAGLSALQLKDLDGAERFLKMAIDIDPAAWQARVSLACVYVQRGNADSAVGELRRARANGLEDPRLLQQTQCFTSLRQDPRFNALLK